MAEVYKIWTSQLAKWKVVSEQGIHLLDITAKSGERSFAPLMSNVMRYKDGSLSEEQYTDIYLRKMKISLEENPSVWKRLLTHKNVAVTCYCGAGKFCHRHLFVPLHQRYLESHGCTVELMGEIAGPNYHPVTQPIDILKPEVSITKCDNITPFYSADNPLSNHSRHGFTIKDVYFKHNEQFIMYCKAKLMGDHIQAEQIMKASHPQACKLLGRKVTPFDNKLWGMKRRKISFWGCYQKAKEHEDVRNYLLSTGNNILVEASPFDRVWGVGISIDDPRIYDPKLWEGINLQGTVWMDVRREFLKDIFF